MKYPNVWTLVQIVTYATHGGVSTQVDGKWVPARPEGFASLRMRLRAAWLVFTGRADAVTWPGAQ
jgi:hypothetical protein